MDSEGEEVATLALGFLCNYGAQHRGVFHGDQYGTCGLPGNTASFQGDGLATILEGFGYWIHNFSPILNKATGAHGPRKRKAA